MPEFRVIGAWRDRPGDGELVVTAATERDAERSANDMGLLVSRVTPMVATRRVSPARVALAVCAGLGILATFTPWVSLPIMGSIAGSAGDGWFSFIGFAVVLAMALSPSVRHPLRWWRRVVATVSASGCAALGVWKMLDLIAIQSEGTGFASAVTIGPGLWLVAIGGVVAAVLAVGFKDRN